MAEQTTQPFEVNEGDTAQAGWSFLDYDDAAIQASDLSTATLILYNLSDATIINSRNGDDILGGTKTGDNDVVITAGGVATWYMQTEDNPIVDTDIPMHHYEEHVALITWTWDPGDGNGVRTKHYEIRIQVKQLLKVP